jgi:hypothetical protein
MDGLFLDDWEIVLTFLGLVFQLHKSLLSLCCTMSLNGTQKNPLIYCPKQVGVTTRGGALFRPNWAMAPFNLEILLK